jgi:hypothetical protein
MSEKPQVKYEIVRKDLIKTQIELEKLLEKQGNLELLRQLGYIRIVK